MNPLAFLNSMLSQIMGPLFSLNMGAKPAMPPMLQQLLGAKSASPWGSSLAPGVSTILGPGAVRPGQSAKWSSKLAPGVSEMLGPGAVVSGFPRSSFGSVGNVLSGRSR